MITGVARIWMLATIATVGLAVNCASLTPLTANTCGNGVVDPGEDCDSFPNGQATCRAPGAAGACHLDCSANTNACPLGWGCGVDDGLCHAPSGTFEELGSTQSGAVTLLTGDFDGDRRIDILSLGRETKGRLVTARFQYFDATGAVAAEVPITSPIIDPNLVDLNQDGATDIMFIQSAASAGLGVSAFVGNTARTVQPVLFPSVTSTLPLRVVPVFVDPKAIDSVALSSDPPPPDTRFAIATSTQGAEVTTIRKNASNNEVLLVLPGATSPDDVLFATGQPGKPLDLFLAATSICGQVALMVAGQTTAQVTSPCKDDSGEIGLTKEPIIQVSLPALGAGDRVSHMFAANTNSNPQGSSDLYFGTDQGRVFVAYSKVLTIDTTATEIQFQTATGTGPLPGSVLTGVDFNSDGRIDIVTGQGVFVSRAVAITLGDAGAIAQDGGTVGVGDYAQAFVKPTATPWVEARVVDLNGDGAPDLVARTDGQPDLDVLLNIAGGLNPSTISTTGTVTRIATGDFDGDGNEDVAYSEQLSNDGSGDSWIVFGTRGGAPNASAPVGAVANVAQMTNLGPQPAQTGNPISALGLVYPDATTSANTDITLAFGSGDRLPLAPVLLASQALLAARLHTASAIDAFAWVAGTSAVTLIGNGLALTPPTNPAAPTADTIGGVAPTTFQRMAAIDTNGDGIDEVVVGDNANLVLLRASSTSGTAFNGTALGTLPAPVHDGEPMFAADLNGDSALDMVVAFGNAAASGTPETRGIAVLFGDGKGNLSAPAILTLPGSAVPTGVTRARIDAGSGPELVVLTQGGADVVRYKGQTPSYASLALGLAGDSGVTFANATSLVGGDLNGDGVDDLAVADSGAIRIFLGKATQ